MFFLGINFLIYITFEYLKKIKKKTFIFYFIFFAVTVVIINIFKLDLFNQLKEEFKGIWNDSEIQLIKEYLKYFELKLDDYLSWFGILISVLVAVYVYILGHSNEVKRYISIYLIGDDNIITLTIYIVVMSVVLSPVFLLYSIGKLIYDLTDAIRMVMLVQNSLKLEEEFEVILERFREYHDTQKLENLLREIQKNFEKSVLNKSIYEVRENKVLFEKILEYEPTLVENESQKSQEERKDIPIDRYEITNFLQILYNHMFNFNDHEIFKELHYLHVKLAGYYYFKVNDKIGFYFSLLLSTQIYKYYVEILKKNESYEIFIYSGFRSSALNVIFDNLEKETEEQKDWICLYIRSIFNLIEKSLEYKDFKSFKNFLYLMTNKLKINYYGSFESKIHESYKLIGLASLMGLELLLIELMEKNQINEKEYINEVEKTFKEHLESFDLKDSDEEKLCRIYLAVNDENYCIKSKLEWNKIFEPPMEILKVNIYSLETDEKFDYIFLRYIKIYSKKTREISEKTLKLLADYHYSLKNSLNKMSLPVESEEYRYYSNFITEIENTYTKKKLVENSEKIISPEKKLKLMEQLEDILRKSQIIKFFAGIQKYEKKRKQPEEIEYFGYANLEKKEYFCDYKSDSLIESIGNSLNNSIGTLVQRGIVQKYKSQQEIESLEKLDKLEDVLGGSSYIIFNFSGYSQFIGPLREKSDFKNKSNLSNEEREKYGDLLIGSYRKMPILNFTGEESGTYVVNKNDIEGFIHYFPTELDENEKIVGYSVFSLQERESFLDKIKNNKEAESILKAPIIKNASDVEEKELILDNLVLLKILQSGELKLKKNAKIYKIRE